MRAPPNMAGRIITLESWFWNVVLGNKEKGELVKIDY